MQKPQITEEDHEGMFWMFIAILVCAVSFVTLIIYLIFQ
jgi:hypothetical protein